MKLDEVLFHLMPVESATSALFKGRQLQQKYLSKSKPLYLTYVNLEKAFDMVFYSPISWLL